MNDFETFAQGKYDQGSTGCVTRMPAWKPQTGAVCSCSCASCECGRVVIPFVVATAAVNMQVACLFLPLVTCSVLPCALAPRPPPSPEQLHTTVEGNCSCVAACKLSNLCVAPAYLHLLLVVCSPGV
jgi:hypothetical protein